MRLGELLVSAGLLSARQVQEALRAQVMWGGRLGTNIVELHPIDLDVVSRLIARQYGLPAAYAQHFEAADPAVQRLLPAELAARHACVPLRRIDDECVVIASVAPLDARARAEIADALRVSPKGLISAIAAELRVHYHLERVFDIPRDARFLRAPGRSKIPSFEMEVDLDEQETTARRPPPPLDHAIPEALLPDFTPRVETVAEPGDGDRRRYIDTTQLGRISVKRMSPTIKIPRSLDEAALAIRRSLDRDGIAQRVVATIEQFLPGSAAALLVVRGDVATSWRGGIAVPLDEPNVVTVALRDQIPVRSPAVNAIDLGLLHALGGSDELVVAPIPIGTHVWLLLAVTVGPDTPVDCVSPVTCAAAFAFARLLRQANR